MASQLAERCFERYFAEKDSSLRTIIDAELAEVREVLDGIGCCCKARDFPNGRQRDDDDHDGLCQRARVLYERLTNHA